MTRLRVRDMGTALFWPTSGTSNYVDLGSTDFSLGDNMTFACWVKNTTGVQGSLWGCKNASNEFQIDMRSANSFMAFVNGVQLAQSPSNSWALGTWVHVVYTRNGAGATHQFYINGSLATTAQLNTGSYASTTSQKTIGARSTTTSPHHGCMDEVAVWSRTLSAEEVAGLYTTGVPPTNSLQGFWKFDEATGTTTADSSGNGRNGTLSTITFTADVPLKPRLALRNMGTAMKFAGTSYVRNASPTNIPDLGAAITLSTWVKIASKSATQFVYGITNSGAAATTQFSIRSGTIKVEKGSGVVLCDITNQPPIGVWAHLVFTSDGTNNKTYVNGVLDTASTTAPGTGATVAVYASTYNGTSEPFTGLLDESLLFNRALTATEVKDLYYNGTKPSGLVLSWLYDEATGSTVQDSSGTGNTGTVSSATFSTDVPIGVR